MKLSAKILKFFIKHSSVLKFGLLIKFCNFFVRMNFSNFGLEKNKLKYFTEILDNGICRWGYADWIENGAVYLQNTGRR